MINSTSRPTVVIVPGLRGHVADHWQTLLGEQLAAAGTPTRTVAPLDEDGLSRTARTAALDAVLHDVDGPVVLVAHSAGVMITVHWVAQSWAQQATRPVLGALLATPADLELPLPEGYPTPTDLDRGGWNPIPRRPLPFRSIVAASTNDPLARYRRVTGMAETWGSRLVTLGEVGHLNPASGYGEWPLAQELLADLVGAPAVGAS